jgi:hypothetical protein
MMVPRRRPNQQRDPALHAGALLGEHLALARVAAGFRTQPMMGREINCETSVIGKIESGERVPPPELLARWLNACGITGQFRLMFEGLELLARAREDPSRVRVAPWFATEAKAHTLRYWTPVIVPGIAQTLAYARELFVAMGFDEAKVAEFLEVRMGRQAIIERPDPPDITMVLWEPVLLHQIGSREVMREQTARLVELSRRSTVTIHVLRSSYGANAGLGGAINLAATDDAPELLLSDGLVEDALSQDPAVVRKARATFNSVRADALNRADSRNVLMEAMERWSD